MTDGQPRMGIDLPQRTLDGASYAPVGLGLTLAFGPLRDRVARTRQVDACDGDRRCHATPAAAAR